MLQQSEIARSILDKLITITYEFTLFNDDGDVWPDRPVFTALARLIDNKGIFDDKAANKCHTQAHKYFLLHTFKIRTKEVVEDADADGSDNSPQQTAKPKPPAPGSPEADIDPARPRVLATEGHTFGTLATEFLDRIRTAATKVLVEEWQTLNAATLDRIKTGSTATYDKIVAGVQGRLAEIAKASKPKPPAPGPVAALATTMPDPKADFTGFKFWLDGKLAAIEPKDAENYDTIWNDSYAPLIDQLLMHEQEECIVLYEKHHNRLAP